MIDAVQRLVAPARRLGEDEGALEHGLGVPREARRGPVGLDAARRHGRRDVRFERRRVAEDAGGAGVADRRVRPVDLLRHGPDEAGEFGGIAVDDRLAELDIAEQAVERVVEPVVRRVREEGRGGFRPIGGGGDAERFLGLEMMEERALGDSRRLAEIIDGGRREALGPDDVPRRFEKPGAGIAAFGVMFGGSRHGLKHTERLVCSSSAF